MTKTIQLFCSATNAYAIVEQEIEYGAVLRSELLGGGEIEQRGKSWVFVGTDSQVCEGFATRGYTLYGASAPERAATHVYRTERGFDAACKRLTGSTVAEHAEAEREALHAYSACAAGA